MEPEPCRQRALQSLAMGQSLGRGGGSDSEGQSMGRGQVGARQGPDPAGLQGREFGFHP